ncbi:MAG TPA: hypothetical protein VFZ49_05310 [Pyrinomonadaceae bacterium]
MEQYIHVLDKGNKVRRPSNPTFTTVVTEGPRPLVHVAGCLTSNSPYDWSVFGFDDCGAEMDRRRKIHDLMTEGERKIFGEYCRLRDEFETEPLSNGDDTVDFSPNFYRVTPK